MKKTIRYRLPYMLGLGFLELCICVATALWLRRLCTGSYSSELVPFVFLLFLSVYSLIMLIERIWRLSSSAGCFRISPDGLEFLPIEYRFLIFRLPVFVRTLPWSCIEDIRVEKRGSHTYLQLHPIDEAEFPKGYSPLVRQVLERGRRRDCYTLPVDITFIDGSPDNLARELRDLLREFHGLNRH